MHLGVGGWYRLQPACLPTPNIYFMHVLEVLGSQRPIKGHLADPPGPILSASARTDCSRPDGCVVAASMTTGHHWASLGIFLVHAADKREESVDKDWDSQAQGSPIRTATLLPFFLPLRGRVSISLI